MLLLPPRIFGCVVFVHLHKNQRSKLDPCAIRCLFLGYAIHQKGYRCYDPATKHTYVTMDVTFLESETFFSSSVPDSPRQGEITNDEPNWIQFNWPSLKDNDTNNTEMKVNKELNTELGTSTEEVNMELNTELGTSLEMPTSSETEAETEDPPPTQQYPTTHLLRIFLR
jgi:hypothetical protein